MKTLNDRWMAAKGFRIVYQGSRCTLDGKPAHVRDAEQGRLAEIRPDDGAPGVQFAWGTVGLIMAAENGRFKS